MWMALGIWVALSVALAGAAVLSRANSRTPEERAADDEEQMAYLKSLFEEL